MKILVLANPKSGVSYHRLLMPMVYLMRSCPEDHCHITNQITEETLEKGQYDVVMMNRCFQTPAGLFDIWRNKYGFKLIVDNDDHWNLDPHHILYQTYKEKGMDQQIERYIEVADIATCTHERLAEDVYKLNKNVHILPNALPYGEGQFADVKQDSEKIRLFWSGSDTHAQDLKILHNPMKRVYGDYEIRNKVKTVMAGYSEKSKPVWDVMISAFTHSLKFDSQIYNFNDVEHYMFAYCDSDVSIIPLLETRFNSMKSNLKVLETAAKKNPAIVSEVNPYLGLPVCYARTQQYWYKWIKELVNDPDMRKEKGQELFDFCNKNFNLHTINQKRKEILSYATNNTQHC